MSSFAKGFKRTLMRNGSDVKISAEQMSMHLGYWKDPCTRRNRQSTGKQVEEEQTYVSYFVKAVKYLYLYLCKSKPKEKNIIMKLLQLGRNPIAPID